MIRRHLFLVFAIFVVLIMAAAGAYKLLSKSAGQSGGAPAGAAAGAAGAGAGRGGGGFGGGAGRGLVVTPVTVGPRAFTDRLEVLGVAKGKDSITLTSNTTEMVEKVLFRPGDQVRRDQVLIELRATEENANILQSRADRDLAKLQADRWTRLADQGVAPRSTAEQYQSALVRAEAGLAAAESRLGDRVIRAPFSGVIGLTDVAPGALISPGTAIATLDDVSTIRVDFDVPDRFMAQVRQGGAIVVKADAWPDERYAGRITRLDTRVDERTRSFKVRAELPNPGGRLKPGMLLRVGIEYGRHEGLAAPEAAIQFSGNQAYAFAIGQRGSGAFAEQRLVTVGVNDNGFIEVRDGLKAGDQIVADGLNRIQPNQAVVVGRGGGAGRAGPVSQGPQRGPGAALDAEGQQRRGSGAAPGGARP